MIRKVMIFLCMSLLLMMLSATCIMRCHFISDLGKIQIPGLVKKVSVDCSLELVSRPLTIDDIITSAAQRLCKISGDLRAAGYVAQGIGFRLLKYIKENPVDASIIAGSMVGLYIITSAIIRSMTASRCPTCFRKRHETNRCIVDYR